MKKAKQKSYLEQLRDKLSIIKDIVIAAILISVMMVGLVLLGLNTDNVINIVFVAFLIGLLIWDLVYHKDRESLYLTIGMLGTFIGICLGLKSFDTVDIGNSLPNLLDGLKLAFITSIAGVFCSIIHKVLSKLPSFKIIEKSEYDQLEKMNDNFDLFIKKIGKSFGNQLQEGLAEALNNLTDDISSKFTESIDNFTESVNNLSTQISSLSELQEKYDEQMEKMDQVANKTTDMLRTISENIDSLDKPLKAIKNLGENSIDAIDSLKIIPESIASVNKLIDEATQKINVMSDEYKNSTDKFFEKVGVEHNTQMVEAGNYAAGIMQKLTDNFASVNEALENASKTLPDTIDELKKRIDEAVKDNKKKNK